MEELLRENHEFREYFNSLPKFIQESLKQNGSVQKSEEELRSIAENMLKNSKK